MFFYSIVEPLETNSFISLRWPSDANSKTYEISNEGLLRFIEVLLR